MKTSAPFLTGPPEVRLVNAFVRPFENAVATARTCYSGKGIVTAEEVSGDHEADPGKRADRGERRDALARDIYQAGHHTTLQHAHFQFAIERVSRHCLWSFLHSHPFYNSEQVSQRYVEVRRGACAVPPLEGRAEAVYVGAVEAETEAYRRLIGVLAPVVADEYYRIFPARRKHPQYEKDVKKKAQEIARYVLPIATFAHLYHTVSGLTLLRYWRACEQFDAPAETRALVRAMVGALLAHDPLYRAILEDPIAIEDTPEWAVLRERVESVGVGAGSRATREFLAEFDASLGARVSRLVDRKERNEEILACAVREVFGIPRAALPDDDAIALVLDPAKNSYFGESLNVTTHSKLSRALHHAAYTFRKKLSHTADSQDQRHRMTPASRPILSAHGTDEPDCIVPDLVKRSPEGLAIYASAMERAWDAARELRSLGVPDEFAQYVLPNALAVRFTESSDLLHLHHKLKSRLCYNAQEEIWRASLDEALQIAEAEPRIGRYLLPPCGVRLLAATTPYCPEGSRYCGVPVWRLDRREYARLL